MGVRGIWIGRLGHKQEGMVMEYGVWCMIIELCASSSEVYG